LRFDLLGVTVSGKDIIQDVACAWNVIDDCLHVEDGVEDFDASVLIRPGDLMAVDFGGKSPHLIYG